MNMPFGQPVASSFADAGSFSEALRQHMLSVYNYMGLGLVITAVLALIVSSFAPLTQLVFGTPLKWVAMLAPLGFIMVLSFNFHRMSLPALQGLFWAFCATMGISMASIFLVFTGESVVRVFFITAAMFGAMSLWGYTTKRDLTAMGGFLMMGLIGIVIASLVNLGISLFTGAPIEGLQFAISVIGVIVFTGLTAWDTQRIKEQFAEGYGQEANGKLAVMGALSLYLNFVNLMQMLLQLIGQRRE